MSKIYFISTPFCPAGFSGTIRVTHLLLDTVCSIAREAIEQGRAVSFIGHEDTARHLGLTHNRGKLKFELGLIAYGVRPKRRLSPGEELNFNEDFEGFMLEVLEERS